MTFDLNYCINCKHSMILAVINIGGFIKHQEIDEEILRTGQLRVAVPRVLTDLVYDKSSSEVTTNYIEFYIQKYDKKNHIAYFDLNKSRPSTIYKPKIYMDGNQWCCLYGENLQDGVAGFGDSPELAMTNFDKEWHQALQKYRETE